MAFTPEQALDRLMEAQAAGRLAHAYLVCGPRGSGRQRVVEEISRRILETEGDVTTHPDFHSIEPESRSRRILIEQVRRIEQAIRAKPVVGTRKVAVIREADRLQPQAANAFLKTLEEPPAGSHVFLTSTAPDALLETVLSRCIVVQLRAGTAQEQSAAAERVLAALESVVARRLSPVTAAFTLSRAFLDTLNAERERIRDEAEEAFKAEQAHYKQTTDGTWLEEREEQIKAMAEAAAVRCRGDLIQAIAGWYAEALRIQHGTAPTTDRKAIHGFAQSATPEQTLRCLEAIEETESNLNRGVQEALAVEAGFLRLFSVQP